MARTVVKKGVKASEKVKNEPLKIIHVFLMVAYGFVTVVTPNLYTLDSNGPKFLALALLNLVTFAFLFTRKELKTHPALFTGFFASTIGAAYTGLMVFSLLSFFNAWNVPEAILHFAKIFTVFSATYLIAVLAMSEKRGLLWLSIAMTIMLIYDCFSVFSEIQAYIQKGTMDIGKIKSSYSNKNILASAIFVKIPFALWLMVFQKKWFRRLGTVTVFIAMIAVFFMTARAFYLGLFALTAFMLIYFLVRYFQSRDLSHLKILLLFISLFITSVLVFSVIEHYYPQNVAARKATHHTKNSGAEEPGVNISTTILVADTAIPAEPSSGVKTQKSSTSITGRLSTINDPSGANRFGGWVRSWHVLKQQPLLGVGLGNWKIVTLKEENLDKPDYVYQYKAHNDFIETATETGIFGGLFFLAIFLLAGWKLTEQLFLKKSPEGLQLFFLPVFGLVCYSFDAFFNFPQDRPEIQALFALYAGMAIALTSLSFSNIRENDSDREVNEALSFEVPFIRKLLVIPDETAGHIGTGSFIKKLVPSVLFFIALAGSAYLLTWNFQSLKLQRIIKQEINKGKLTSPADKFLTGFPPIPNLNVVGEPIAVQKARYLINEKRYDEAIAIIKNDHASPYDTRPEYFLAMAYYEKKMPDSAMYYAGKVYEMKPLHFKNISMLTNLMVQKGQTEEAEAIIEKFLSGKLKDKDACLYASSFYDRTGKIDKAIAIIDSAATWFPADTSVVKQRTYIHRRQVILNNKETLDAALAAFKAKRYPEAVNLLNKILTDYPDYTEALEYRAFSYFFLKEHTKSIADIRLLFENGVNRSNLHNLMGVNYYNLRNREEACKSFKIARDAGDKDGTNNYNRFCGGQTQPRFPPPIPKK